MFVEMVEEGEGCYIGIKFPGISKVTKSRVCHNSLIEDLDAKLSGLISLSGS